MKHICRILAYLLSDLGLSYPNAEPAIILARVFILVGTLASLLPALVLNRSVAGVVGVASWVLCWAYTNWSNPSNLRRVWPHAPLLWAIPAVRVITHDQHLLRSAPPSSLTILGTWVWHNEN